LDFSVEPLGRYVRVVAIVTLLLGLSDAARLLGVSLGAQSPVEAMGLKAFIFLAAFTLALLFSAVGLWIKASWGAVLLGAATASELVLFLTGNQDVRMTIYGFGIRLVLLAALFALFVFQFRMRHAAQPD
jgi:Family of unknown function (DUF6163)